MRAARRPRRHVLRLPALLGVALLLLTGCAAGASEGKPNPHAWMSPRAAQRYTDTIAEALAELSPEHAEEFRENARRYQEQLEQVHTEVQDAVAALPADHRVLLSCEGAFSYLARDTGLSEHYLWPVNSDDQGTAQQIRSAIDTVRQRGVPAVFCESTVSDATMRQVVDATEARYGGTLYVDSLSEEGGPVPTFLDLLRHDARTITAGLSGDQGGEGS